MGSIIDTIEALEAAGADAETIVRAIKHLAAKDESRAAERRSNDRNRKRRQRASQSIEKIEISHADNAGQAVTPRDTSDPLLSPHTPLTTPPSKNPPKGGQKGSRPDIREAMDRIWPRLPAQARRCGEPGARTAMARLVLSGVDPADVERAVAPWLEASGDCVDRFDRWLTDEKWREWLPAKPPGTDWRGEVEIFKRFGSWRPDGPCPDQPGCLAPANVLAEFGYRQENAA
jgi:hypothetical protein